MLEGLPCYSEWSYDKPNLPANVHNRKSNAAAAFKWLDDLPYLDRDGQYVGRTTGESIALAVGLMIQDICAMHFSRLDPDGEDDVNIPKFVTNSNIDFAVLEEIVIPFCDKMRMCIGYKTSTGNSASQSNTPVAHSGKAPTENEQQRRTVAKPSGRKPTSPAANGEDDARPAPKTRNPPTQKKKQSETAAPKRKKTSQVADDDSSDDSDDQPVNKRQRRTVAKPSGRKQATTANGKDADGEAAKGTGEEGVPVKPPQKRKRSGAAAPNRKNTSQVANGDSADDSEDESANKRQRRTVAKPGGRNLVANEEDSTGEVEKGSEGQPPLPKTSIGTAKKSKSVKVLPNLQGDKVYQHPAAKPTATKHKVPEARSQPRRQAKQDHSQIPPNWKVKRTVARKKPA